ncbi:dual specificity protein phosphatase 18-like isoform X1 [Osmerus mordax]|uniref:dual specificity protein phosphatase 18-like isoform X1 n=2 Tax=Osmerus mordax TaxID=8014 RepID=UPI00351089C1
MGTLLLDIQCRFYNSLPGSRSQHVSLTSHTTRQGELVEFHVRSANNSLRARLWLYTAISNRGLRESHKSVHVPNCPAQFTLTCPSRQATRCPCPMSVSQITPSLFLSGVDAAQKLTLITNRNITLIINATAELIVYPNYKGVEVLHVPVQDQPHAPLRHYFESVAESIHNNHSGHTLVHCSAGRSRSPALIMAYLMKHKGVSLRQAHEWVLENRPHIRPNAGFWRQLMEYERDLHGKNTVRMVATPCGVFPEALDNEENSAYCMNV